MSSTNLFDKETIDRLLKKFLAELDENGVHGVVWLVGGAALSLYYFERDVTQDIDADFPSDPRVLEIIKQIAKDEGIPESWLNSDAKMFFGFPPEEFWVVKDKVGGVTLKVGTPKLLLVMKLKASRGRRDSEDIEELLRLTGVKSIEEVKEIYEEVYAQEVLKVRAIEQLKSYFGA